MEGTTQGYLLAMAMYALAITQLIDQLRARCPTVHQPWYTDDATGASACRKLNLWWNELTSYGPSFGYYPNASKTYVVVKEKHESSAKETFTGTDVHIIIHGNDILGLFLLQNFTEE